MPLISIIRAFCLILCLAPSISTSKTIVTGPPLGRQNTWINVFVHGILSLQAHVAISDFRRFMRDDVENTIYAKAVELMREDPFFYKSQAMRGYGLQRINPNAIGPGQSSALFAHLYDMMISASGNKRSKNIYYTYGWSGLLSAKSRYQEAEHLFIDLELLIHQLQSRGITPKIRLIGYSHGGNVCLNLAAIQQDKHPNSSLTIDELILLGTPIQPTTDHYIAHDIFTSIYNIYSLADRVQCIDPFTPQYIFSKRTFRKRHNFALPKKLKQVQLKITRCTKNTPQDEKRFNVTRNFNQASIVSGRNHLLRDASPGHAELWFFGWTPEQYRSSFPLYPLPAVAFAPFITHHMEHMFDDIPTGKSLIFDIRPEHDVVLIRKQGARKTECIIPFVQQQKLKEINAFALSHAPETYTSEQYYEQIHRAYEQAKTLYEEFMVATKEGFETHALCSRRKRQRTASKSIQYAYVEHTAT